jgi:CRISPR-associated endonuclease/helicase Cas3
MTLSPRQFEEFYCQVHGCEDVFPWQQMLVERVVELGWPECIELPTASGKTAGIDIAAFALACQADRPVHRRSTGRRIFYVVDRRILVDAAFARAERLAHVLAKAEKGVVRQVADHLRSLHPGTQPLAVARIRGGVARDDGWVRSPAAPTVITGTVDQVGSRLLFRAYGAGDLVAPIHAGLVANDSLLFIDEAHCAIPFFQTAKAVERYRGPEWAKDPIVSPFNVVVMSATPPPEATTVFPESSERAVALKHPLLVRRIDSAKPAELVIARKPETPKRGAPGLRSAPLTTDNLVLDACDRALRLAADGAQRIAIMVNRVGTARAIHAQFRSELSRADAPLDAELVLMTGRMRPLDRDALVAEWEPKLLARQESPPLDRPVVVVTTQCLEVGADFSFDALVTECASLDALRQRFGRLDRFGMLPTPKAAVLIRSGQVMSEEKLTQLGADAEADDPVYGNALARTWNWLGQHAVSGGPDGRREFDFGIAAVDRLLSGTDRWTTVTPLLAPSSDAPVMLPAHVDSLSQTAPRPRPDPDVALFLHGRGRGVPDVHVVLRADLGHTEEAWPETVTLCPPSSLEAFPVPIHVFRNWLAEASPRLESVSDLESAASPSYEPNQGVRRALIWRGRDDSRVSSDPSEIRPYDVLVVPADVADVEVLGDVPRGAHDSRVLDLGDVAFLKGRARPMLRLHGGVLMPWARHPAVQQLLLWAEEEGRADDDSGLEALLSDLAEAAAPVQLDDGSDAQPPPEWMRQSARALSHHREIVGHPCGKGYVLTSQRRIRSHGIEKDGFADADDLTSEGPPVSLEDHLKATAAVAREFARNCLPPPHVDAVVRAAELHDLGKADWRFQVMLHGGNELEALRRGALLAKSSGIARSPSARRRARDLSGLPHGFRHEVVSVQIAESFPELLAGADPELVLHLVASHHGHGRPFAPIVPDVDPPDLSVASRGLAMRLNRGQRLNLVPAHRIDSGIAERFWCLTHRYGWWGLAYLEATARLADWDASERHEAAIAEPRA